jgi:hypothetical protein
VVLEQDDPDLNWETGSYAVRNKSRQGGELPYLSPLLPVDLFLGRCSLTAMALAIFIAIWRLISARPDQPIEASLSVSYLAIVVIASIVWRSIWAKYSQTVNRLENMTEDLEHAMFWKTFKPNLTKVKAEQLSELERFRKQS